MSSSISKQFLINTSHYVGANKFQYNFPQGRNLKLNSDSEISVASCSIYNSTFNIKASWGNNSFVIFCESLILASIPAGYEKGGNYTDPNNGTYINKKYVKIVIPDGYYDISSLDAYLQQQCQAIGFYLQSSNASSNMYFIDFITNPQRYSTQIDIFFIPTSLPTGFLMPSNSCFSLASGSAKTPFLYFPAPIANSKYGALNDIFGFSNGACLPFLPASATTYSLSETQNLSTKCPRVSPIACYIMACNLVQNEIAIPDDLLLQLNLGESQFGGIVKYQDFPQFITCKSISTSSVILSFFDENLNPLEFQDPQFSCVITLRQYAKK